MLGSMGDLYTCLEDLHTVCMRTDSNGIRIHTIPAASDTSSNGCHDAPLEGPMHSLPLRRRMGRKRGICMALNRRKYAYRRGRFLGSPNQDVGLKD